MISFVNGPYEELGPAGIVERSEIQRGDRLPDWSSIKADTDGINAPYLLCIKQLWTFFRRKT